MTVAIAELRDRLEGGNDKRIRAAAEWRALVGEPRSVVEAALRNPSATLACKRLGTLFGANGHQSPGVVPNFGPARLRRALVKVAAAKPNRRFFWGPDLRLRDLTEAERERFVDAVIELAPKWWRES